MWLSKQFPSRCAISTQGNIASQSPFQNYTCSFLNPTELFFRFLSSLSFPRFSPFVFTAEQQSFYNKAGRKPSPSLNVSTGFIPSATGPHMCFAFMLSCNGGFRCFWCCCQALKAEWYKCGVKRILRSLTAIADKAGNSPAHTKQLLLWTGSRDVLWCILGLT